jgi:hypothetical protein
MESCATQEVTAVQLVVGTKLEAEMDYEDEYSMQQFLPAQHPPGHPHGGFGVFVT